MIKSWLPTNHTWNFTKLQIKVLPKSPSELCLSKSVQRVSLAKTPTFEPTDLWGPNRVLLTTSTTTQLLDSFFQAKATETSPLTLVDRVQLSMLPQRSNSQRDSPQLSHVISWGPQTLTQQTTPSMVSSTLRWIILFGQVLKFLLTLNSH